MMVNSCLISGGVLTGIFSEMTYIAYKTGVPYEKAATLLMFSSFCDMLFRPCWSLVTKRVHRTTCQVVYCCICFASQIVFINAKSYEMFIVGLVLHAAVMAGYNGLKVVIWIDIVTYKERVNSSMIPELPPLFPTTEFSAQT